MIRATTRASQNSTSCLSKICSVCGDVNVMNLYTIIEGSLYCQFCSMKSNIEEQREGARRGQKRCADNMLLASNKKYKPINVGETVMVQVPSFDRGPLDSKNVVGKVLCISSQGLYQIGTSAGILNRWLPRNSISLSPLKMTADIPNTTMLLRAVSSKQSQFGGQGVKKCSCKTKCMTARSICRKSNMLCNSRCPSSTTCHNK
ncbi:hypothetical protein V9T40_005226 [Parthenolecanium corni]|uniref:Uncharacterized protein n=1 Tax=Parthenolecanium corni TaxID=536013 RepID=A0AAN9TDF6_9HEMI